jgi:hypothetical protein
MSKRRDWDKVRAEDKVARHGSDPLHRDHAQDGDLAIAGTKILLASDHQHAVFHYDGYRCKPSSDLTDFAKLNHLDETSPETLALFQRISTIVREEFDELVEFILRTDPNAARNRTISIRPKFHDFWRLRCIQGKQLHCIIGRMENNTS